MDRRHRSFLNPRRLGWWLGGVAACLSGGRLRAQDATPAGSPALSATPWVQASLPASTPTASPKPADLPKPPKAPKPKPANAGQDFPGREKDDGAYRAELARHQMEKRREEESARENESASKENARLEQLPPDEREAFQRNLPEGEDFGFLPKPFSLKQLIEAVKGATTH